MIYLLDTNTIIYWMKGNRHISQKVLSVGYNNIAASDITKAELYYGAYKSRRTEENLLSIKNLTEKINFLVFNDRAQESYGELKASLEKQGNRIDDMDIMIASTALAYNLILVTNDIAHMDRIPEITIENWT